MQTLPQELVDRIIDELVHLEYYRPMAQYSLISRAWVTRTQQHSFRFLVFYINPEDLEEWQRKIEPDPAGVSRHVRVLTLDRITSLEGFEAHMHAFTRVEDLRIGTCSFMLSPLVAEFFAPMGSSLVELSIFDLETTSGAITSLLAALPQLKTLKAEMIKVTDDTDGADLTVRVPFFEGGNWALFYPHLDQQGPPGPPDWIPPSARFSDLKIDITYLLYKAGLVNRWFSNSSTNLTSLAIYGDPVDVFLPNQFTPLDLSPCHSLAKLYISVRLYTPGIIAETVLPSIVSSQLSYVCLHAEDNLWDGEIDYPVWAAVEGHLCRLAKLFSVENPGKKMVVGISGHQIVIREDHFLDLLPKLKEEVATYD